MPDLEDTALSVEKFRSISEALDEMLLRRLAIIFCFAKDGLEIFGVIKLLGRRYKYYFRVRSIMWRIKQKRWFILFEAVEIIRLGKLEGTEILATLDFKPVFCLSF